MLSRTRLAVLAVAATLGASCALGTRTIADIQHDPGRYYDRSVSIEGTVTSSFGGPFVPVQFYRVDDGTGEITVVANDARGVPRKGAHVEVKGHVQELASIGDRSFGLHLRQEHLSVKRR